jgi:hypothetical protein
MTYCLSSGPLVFWHVCIKFILLIEESSPEHTFPVQVLRCETEKNEDMRREGGEESLLYRFCEPAQNT